MMPKETTSISFGHDDLELDSLMLDPFTWKSRNITGPPISIKSEFSLLTTPALASRPYPEALSMLAPTHIPSSWPITRTPPGAMHAGLPLGVTSPFAITQTSLVVSDPLSSDSVVGMTHLEVERELLKLSHKWSLAGGLDDRLTQSALSCQVQCGSWKVALSVVTSIHALFKPSYSDSVLSSPLPCNSPKSEGLPGQSLDEMDHCPCWQQPVPRPVKESKATPNRDQGPGRLGFYVDDIQIAIGPTLDVTIVIPSRASVDHIATVSEAVRSVREPKGPAQRKNIHVSKRVTLCEFQLAGLIDAAVVAVVGQCTPVVVPLGGLLSSLPAAESQPQALLKECRGGHKDTILGSCRSKSTVGSKKADGASVCTLLWSSARGVIPIRDGPSQSQSQSQSTSTPDSGRKVEPLQVSGDSELSPAVSAAVAVTMDVDEHVASLPSRSEHPNELTTLSDEMSKMEQLGLDLDISVNLLKFPFEMQRLVCERHIADVQVLLATTSASRGIFIDGSDDSEHHDTVDSTVQMGSLPAMLSTLLSAAPDAELCLQELLFATAYTIVAVYRLSGTRVNPPRKSGTFKHSARDSEQIVGILHNTSVTNSAREMRRRAFELDCQHHHYSFTSQLQFSFTLNLRKDVFVRIEMSSQLVELKQISKT